VRARTLAVAAVLLAAVPAAAQETSDQPAIGAALAGIANDSTIELSTVGRKTQRIHTRPIWFVVDDGRIFVQSGRKGTTDWYRNVQQNPGVTVRTARWTIRGEAHPVTDPEQAARVRKLFLGKYTTAWLLSFVGSEIGQGLPVVITPETVTPRT
jgi:deazaflavin-dependent oxidoreductase (nitroreductase family)